MDQFQTFVNFTHPSQMQSLQVRRKVRSFTTKHNMRRKYGKNGAACQTARTPPSPKTDDSDTEEIVRQNDPAPGSSLSRPSMPNERRKRRPLELSRVIRDRHFALLEPYRAHAGEHISRLLDYCTFNPSDPGSN